MRRGRPKHPDTLTPRELEVLELLRERLTNQGIAVRLGVSENTAKYHVAQILSKLGVSTREEAAAWVQRERTPWAGLTGMVPSLFAKKSTVINGALGLTAASAAVGLVLLFIAAVGNRSDAPIIGPLGKIAYIQDGDVWMKGLPDGRPRRITRDANNSRPLWSPSGDWLLYTHTPTQDGMGPPKWDVVVVRPDGSGRRQLASTGPSAAWLEGSDRLLYFAQDLTVVTEDVSGANRWSFQLAAQTSPNEEGMLGPVIWSHDGRWIAYVERHWEAGSDRPDRPGAGPWTYVGLWVISVDGTGLKELLNLGGPTRDGIFPVAWSADNRSVLFSVVPASLDALSPLDGLPLRQVSATGGPPREVGANLLVVGMQNISPAPDGSQDALVIGGLQETWTNKRIAVLDAEGRLRELTGPETAALAPAWSRDGRQIAYVASADMGPSGRDASLSSRRIWMMSADGTRKRQLTADQGFRDESPQWSKEGNQILFARLTNENSCDTSSYSVWLLDVGDGSLRQVTDTLPLFATRNERLVVGEVPKCQAGSSSGPVTDWMGSLSLGAVMDWWQPGYRAAPVGD